MIAFDSLNYGMYLVVSKNCVNRNLGGLANPPKFFI